ncbi:7452_t:CDS:2, partial [Gigaspora margarita]
MTELHDQVSQYIGFEPNEICLPITEEDRQVFREIIADQELMGDIVMDDYQFLLHHGHNSKGACTVSQAEKVLINLPEDLSEKVLAHIEKRFEEVPLAPVLICFFTMTNHIITINRKSNIEQVSTDDSNFSISIGFPEPPNEIFFLEIVAADIKEIRESRGKIPNASKKIAEKFHIGPKRPEVLSAIIALKNVVRDGEAKPNSSEVLEGG